MKSSLSSLNCCISLCGAYIFQGHHRQMPLTATDKHSGYVKEKVLQTRTTDIKIWGVTIILLKVSLYIQIFMSFGVSNVLGQIRKLKMDFEFKWGSQRKTRRQRILSREVIIISRESFVMIRESNYRPLAYWKSMMLEK